MSRSFDHEPASSGDRRGVKLLSLAGGAALGMLLLAFGAHDFDGSAPARWTDNVSPSAPALAEPDGPAPRVAALDVGVDWHAAEAWTEFGPAAVAAYER